MSDDNKFESSFSAEESPIPLPATDKAWSQMRRQLDGRMPVHAGHSVRSGKLVHLLRHSRWLVAAGTAGVVTVATWMVVRSVRPERAVQGVQSVQPVKHPVVAGAVVVKAATRAGVGDTSVGGVSRMAAGLVRGDSGVRVGAAADAGGAARTGVGVAASGVEGGSGSGVAEGSGSGAGARSERAGMGDVSAAGKRSRVGSASGMGNASATGHVSRVENGSRVGRGGRVRSVVSVGSRSGAQPAPSREALEDWRRRVAQQQAGIPTRAVIGAGNGSSLTNKMAAVLSANRNAGRSPLAGKAGKGNPGRTAGKAKGGAGQRTLTIGIWDGLNFVMSGQTVDKRTASDGSGTLEDHLPGAYARLYMGNRIYLEAGVRLYSPQYTRVMQIDSTGTTAYSSPTQGTVTDTLITLEKLYYTDIPVTVHFRVAGGLYLGAGLTIFALIGWGSLTEYRYLSTGRCAQHFEREYF